MSAGSPVTERHSLPLSLELSATQYLPLPANLLNFMEGKTRIAGEIAVVPRNKSDIRYRPGVMAEKVPPADHELVMYRTIKKPTKKRHKHKAVPVATFPSLTTESVVKPQDSPAWIRHKHLQEFYLVREHQNAIAELARKNMFQSSFTDENEIVLPWKSPSRTPRKARKPKSPYILDEPSQKYSEKSSMKSSKGPKNTSTPIVTNYTPLLSKTKEISLRDKLAIENYHVMNPSNNSSQSVYSSFLSLPEGHIFTDNGKPPIEKFDTTTKKSRNFVTPQDPKNTGNVIDDDDESQDSNFTDSTTRQKVSQVRVTTTATAAAADTGVIKPIAGSGQPPRPNFGANHDNLPTVPGNTMVVGASGSLLSEPIKKPLIRISVTTTLPTTSNPVSPAGRSASLTFQQQLQQPSGQVPFLPPKTDHTRRELPPQIATPLVTNSPTSHHENTHQHHDLTPSKINHHLRSKQKPMNTHMFRSPSPSKSPEPSTIDFVSVNDRVSDVDKRLKYMYGSPSAAVNLNSPPGYPSTDETIGLKMKSAPALTTIAPTLHTTEPEQQQHRKKNHDEDSSQDSKSEMNDDDELNSLSSESRVDHQPVQPPRIQSVGNLEFADKVTQFFVNGMHYTLPPTKAELTMAQKAKARDAQVKKLSDIQLAQAEKIRLQRLVDEFGLEQANKIEGARRWRQAKKQQIIDQPAIYALSNAGCTLVSRRLARVDALPAQGIVKDCAWQEDWPTATAGPERSIQIFDGIAVVTAPIKPL